jgi:transcriptional regulator with XRE-family HTH domain
MAVPIPRGYHAMGYTLVVTPWSPTARTARRETRLAERITDPIVVPASLWQRADTTDAMRSRDMRRLFHLLRQYAGASQTRIGIACGLTQGKVSAIMSGSHQVTTLEVFERIADGLGMPPQARLALGLAPSPLDLTSPTAIPTRDGRSPQPFRPAASALIVDSSGLTEAEDPVRRRAFTRLAGATLVGAVLADNAAGTGPLRSADALVTAGRARARSDHRPASRYQCARQSSCQCEAGLSSLPIHRGHVPLARAPACSASRVRQPRR